MSLYQSFVWVGSCIWVTLNIGASSYLVGTEGREITKNSGIFILGEGIRLYKLIWLRKQGPRKSCDPQTCPGASQGGESSEEFQIILSPPRYQKAQAYQDQKHWKFHDLQSECWQQVCIMGPPPPPPLEHPGWFVWWWPWLNLMPVLSPSASALLQLLADQGWKLKPFCPGSLIWVCGLVKHIFQHFQ